MNSFYGVLGTERLPAARFAPDQFDHQTRPRHHPADGQTDRGARLRGHLRRYRFGIRVAGQRARQRRGGRDRQRTGGDINEVLARSPARRIRHRVLSRNGVRNPFQPVLHADHARFRAGQQEALCRRDRRWRGRRDTSCYKGLETVRTDWTELARRFQQKLYRR